MRMLKAVKDAKAVMQLDQMRRRSQVATGSINGSSLVPGGGYRAK